MQKAFGNECMNKTRIKEWYNRFKGGRTSVDSDPRSGRPSAKKKLDNIERVRLAIQGDRGLTVRELENDLGMFEGYYVDELIRIVLKSRSFISHSTNLLNDMFLETGN